MEAIRRWPLPASYAPAFSAREYGQTAYPVTAPFRDTNYETQQSPLYYWTAGLLLRLVPSRTPLEELYLLRLVNAALAFSVGLLLGKVVRPSPLAWVPVALLALIPGFGIEMCRVANDALCTALISLAVAGALSARSDAWIATAGSFAAGIAPWGKLYGLAVLPVAAVREALRKDTRNGMRLLRLLAIGAPAIVLTICSLKMLGHPFPMMYNIRHAPVVSVMSVPWLRDAWGAVKSSIWMSGMSFLVFPTWVYFLTVMLLGWGLALTLLTTVAPDRENLAILVGSAAVFVLALAYNDWRAFSFYGGAGGTGGWYLWAIVLPEMLLLTGGAMRRGMVREWILPTLIVFFFLTISADITLLVDSIGLIVRTPRGHVLGIARAPAGQMIHAYLGSRPTVIAIAAVTTAAGSWLLAGSLILAAGRLRPRHDRGPLEQTTAAPMPP